VRPVVDVVERDGTPEDAPFVFQSWLKSARDAWPDVRTSDYYDLQHARIEKLLVTARLIILHPVSAPLVICAWAVLDAGGPDVAHYVHVKGEYRGQGFARRLLAGRTVATHMTKDGLALKRKLQLRYMPHLLDELGA
jgi:GNAT superfamily N-acetyltransferase